MPVWSRIVLRYGLRARNQLRPERAAVTAAENRDVGDVRLSVFHDHDMSPVAIRARIRHVVNSTN